MAVLGSDARGRGRGVQTSRRMAAAVAEVVVDVVAVARAFWRREREGEGREKEKGERRREGGEETRPKNKSPPERIPPLLPPWANVASFHANSSTRGKNLPGERRERAAASECVAFWLGAAAAVASLPRGELIQRLLLLLCCCAAIVVAASTRLREGPSFLLLYPSSQLRTGKNNNASFDTM